MFLVIVLFAIFAPYMQCHQIHEQMTDQEIVEVFGTSSSAVPKYEVVPITYMFDKLSARKTLKTRFFGQYIVLDLSPVKEDENSKYTKIWKGKKNDSSPTGVSFTYLGESHSVHIQGELHHDVKRSASVMVNKDEGDNPLFDGMIGGNLAIRSLPERFRLNSNDFHPDLNFADVGDKDSSLTYSHVVYQIPSSGRKFENLTRDEIYEKKNIEVETLYPEIMIVMDEILLGRFNNDVLKAVEYIVMFWHGVDMKFMSLVNPEFHLNLAQIVLMEDTMPFMKKSSEEGTIMIANEAIEAMRAYFYLEDELGQFQVQDDYDIAMLMTGYDMSFKIRNSWDKKVHGVAHNGGACRKVKNMLLATGIFEDNAGFRGILTGFHELGHLLGADHDGMVNRTSEKCPVKEGYVMGGQSGTNMFLFSRCSINAIQEHMQSGRSPCMKNSPPIKNTLHEKLFENVPDKYIIPVRLPGQYFTLEEQCNGNTPCYKDARVCTNLCCKNDAAFKFWKQPLYDRAPAADGSPCGHGRICYSGYCMGISVSPTPPS